MRKRYLGHYVTSIVTQPTRALRSIWYRTLYSPLHTNTAPWPKAALCLTSQLGASTTNSVLVLL